MAVGAAALDPQELAARDAETTHVKSVHNLRQQDDECRLGSGLATLEVVLELIDLMQRVGEWLQRLARDAVAHVREIASPQTQLWG